MEYDPAWIDALEPSQTTAAKQQKLPRRRLSHGILALLALLRIYVLIAVPLVIYAFFIALRGSH